MLDRLVVGDVPAKHHIVHRGPDGALRWEECITRRGFDGAYTLAYHLRRPHEARGVDARHGWTVRGAAEPALRRRHYRGQDWTGGGPAVDARTPILVNDDVIVSVAKVDQPDPVYVANGDADELLYVHEGSGVLVSPFGTLRFGPEDYVGVPKGIVHRIVPDPGQRLWLLSIEGQGLGLLSKWRNDVGQLRMDAPYCHRDFRTPVFEGPTDEGLREQVVKREGRWHGFVHDHSPLDLVGWDGAVYPWAFPIRAFQPRTGQVHLPPDTHGTFAVRGALVCSFVPRVVDFHPQAIPCPYPHSSVDCDEFLLYCAGNFTSRKGVGPGSMSFHPYGVPHGPHPGALEASVGTVRTDELAVMLDTFKPLRPTTAAATIEDPGYHDSFRA